MFRPKRVFVLPLDVSEISFNPCSRGCFARRTRSRESEPSGNRFQSLFSWMFRPKSPFPPPTTFLRGFNPCSRGCFARRQAMTRQASHTQRCFNPCSRGCFARRPSHPSSRPAGIVSILVLVDVSPEDFIIFIPRRSYLSVSILVLVDVSPEEYIVRPKHRIGMFQSLFSWMFRPKARLRTRTRPAQRFQSLFSWMFRPKLRQS